MTTLLVETPVTATRLSVWPQYPSLYEISTWVDGIRCDMAMNSDPGTIDRGLLMLLAQKVANRKR